MSKPHPIIGLYEDNEDAAKVIALLVEKGYTEEEIYVLAEDPEYFGDAIEEAKALVERGLSETEVDDYMKHLKVGDVLVLVDSDNEHYSETLDIVNQVAEQAPRRCHCEKQGRKNMERVVGFFGQRLFNKDIPKERTTSVNERGETICDLCQGIVSPEDQARDADRIVRDYMGQPLFRKSTSDEPE